MVDASAEVRILIAAKDPEQCRSIEEALAPRYRCESVQTAAGALERILSPGDYAVIFCDLVLEDAKGLALYRAVRALRTEALARIVFLSGQPSGDPSEDVLASLPNWVLYKPVDVRTLELAVQRKLEQP